ncbi:MAG: iron-sulfur cluster insertion protein ErpA [Nitrososphaerales archaeon]
MTKKVLYEPELVKITEMAAKKVKEFIEKEGNSKLNLRLYVTGGGCSGLSYGLALDDEINDDDLIVEQNGIKVVVDSFTVPFIRGSVIDYEESLQSSGFRIDNPNVRSTCACGHSFNV